MMVHRAVTVMAVLWAHKKKGRKCTQICSAHVVPNAFFAFYIPYLPYCSIIAEKNIFPKVRALEMLHFMRLRVYTFACIAFNNSERFEEMFQIRAR